jgi:iron(III) transport system substrate-binding protein
MVDCGADAMAAGAGRIRGRTDQGFHARHWTLAARIVNNRQTTVDIRHRPMQDELRPPGHAPSSSGHRRRARSPVCVTSALGGAPHEHPSPLDRRRPGAGTCRRRALAQKTQLLVYTALETDQLKAYQEGFNKVHPDIEIKWVRDSTGVITAKLLAEKANPQADAVMGVAASSLALLDKNGMLEPYKPLNLDAIMSQYRDKKSPPAWFGMDVWGATVCFNTVEAQEAQHPQARDLEGPDQARLQGPDRDAQPGQSGHRLLRRDRLAHAVGRRQRQGRRLEVHGRAAREHRAVHALRLQALQHGRVGEFVVGISFEYRANANKAKGAPIDLVFPKEGLGWDLEAFAIHKGTKKLDAAKKLADWAQQGRDDAVRQELRHHRAARAWPRRWPMCPRTTRPAW